MENRYVSQRISEAQKNIENKEFQALEKIYNELKNTRWEVTIPTIVLQKIEKIVGEYRKSEAKKGAMRILERINNAYASYDFTSLDDALLCWKEHCANCNYVPDKNESMQLKEASEYWETEKKKQKAEHDFQMLIEHITSLLNAEAPLSEVEKQFGKAKTFEHQIPQHLSNRVEQYRVDFEREQRTATIIKSLKIIGTSAVALFIIAWGVIWYIQASIEETQSQNLELMIKKGQIVEAEALLKEIEKEYPKLASRPKILKAKATLHKLATKEKARVDEFERISREITALRKDWPPKRAVKEKLASLEKIAQSELEKNRVNEIRGQINDDFTRYAEEAETRFLTEIQTFKNNRDEIYGLIQKNEFDFVDTKLVQLEKLHQEIIDIPVSNDLMYVHKDLLNSPKTLRNIYESKINQFTKITKAQNAILEAKNFSEIEATVNSYEQILQEGVDQFEFVSYEQTIKDIAYLKAILAYQSYGTTIPSEYAEMDYFKNVKKYQDFSAGYIEKCNTAQNELISYMNIFQQNLNRDNQAYIRIKVKSTIYDLYVKPETIFSFFVNGQKGISVTTINNLKISFKIENERIKVRLAGEEYTDCTLLSPTYLTIEDFKASKSPQLLLINRICNELQYMDKMATLKTGIRFLETIQENEKCPPFWKMQLSLYILQAITPLDLSPSKYLTQLLSEFQKLKVFDDVPENQLNNKNLSQKIKSFYRTYDFSVFNKVCKENDIVQNFIEKQKTYQFQYLGFAIKSNNTLKYTIAPRLKNVTTEVFCFDTSTSGCQLVGRHTLDGLIIYDKFKDYVVGRILFTTDPGGSINQIYDNLKNNKAGINLNDIEWPIFWPQNMKGDLK